MLIAATIWRHEQEQRHSIATAWRIAALSRTKRLPSLKQLLSDGPSKVLRGKELQRRREEYQQMTANVDMELLKRRFTRGSG